MRPDWPPPEREVVTVTGGGHRRDRLHLGPAGAGGGGVGRVPGVGGLPVVGTRGGEGHRSRGRDHATGHRDRPPLPAEVEQVSLEYTV